ncbi:SCAN domaincontaining protein 3like [Trichonephila clavipes]|nr:SCAN domaincontaining protein 3like [Trichonephila clavipes]
MQKRRYLVLLPISSYVRNILTTKTLNSSTGSKKCEVTDTALLVIVNHLNNLSANFKERFLDLKQIDFPTWMMQPMLVDLSDTVSNMQYQAELAELQNDDSVKTLFSIKGAMAGLCEETEIK